MPLTLPCRGHYQPTVENSTVENSLYQKFEEFTLYPSVYSFSFRKSWQVSDRERVRERKKERKRLSMKDCVVGAFDTRVKNLSIPVQDKRPNLDISWALNYPFVIMSTCNLHNDTT